MDRSIVYPGAIPLDTDLLNINRDAMVALGALIQVVLGAGTFADGLMVAPTVPASLAVVVGPGSITQIGAVDTLAYGSLGADVTDQIAKMGINLSEQTFPLAAPTSSGESVAYLVEASFLETDTVPVVLPYFNAASPSQPFLGPGNAGTAQATRREQRVQLQVKPGTAAISGTQTAPAVDAGWIGLAVVTVAYGQTQVTAANITPPSSSSALMWKLPQLRPGFSEHQVFTTSGNFAVPSGITRLRVTAVGGGGAGGTHATLPGGGGGAGGRAVAILAQVAPGQAVPVTVGAAGIASAVAANGGSGGTSSFGTFVSATGGAGGTGGSGTIASAGMPGGIGVGGDLNDAGGYGTDASIPAARGGDGGGSGAGRGSTGAVPGLAALGFGGGGGGGGSSIAGGPGVGAIGGNGGGGLVVVEY